MGFIRKWLYPVSLICGILAPFTTMAANMEVHHKEKVHHTAKEHHTTRVHHTVKEYHPVRARHTEKQHHAVRTHHTVSKHREVRAYHAEKEHHAARMHHTVIEHHAVRTHHRVKEHHAIRHTKKTHYAKTYHAVEHYHMPPSYTSYIGNQVQLSDFFMYPPAVKQLINQAMHLSDRHLAYIYGSDNPSRGGMDCSGTIQYLLTNEGLKNVPRESDQLYRWVWQQGRFYAVNSTSMDSFEFSHLKPGDLLFWSDTYRVKRAIPVTHVMLYLGRNRQGEPLMFGASDSGVYHTHWVRGVNVFDFNMARRGPGHFLGYGCIPDVNCGLTNRITYAWNHSSIHNKTFF